MEAEILDIHYDLQTLTFDHDWSHMREGLEMFTDDFLADEIKDLPPQERDFTK